MRNDEFKGVRALTPDDANEFIRVRREALEREPFAFGASPLDDRASSGELVRAMLGRGDQAVFGAFAPALSGIVGLVRNSSRKGAHKAHVWGLYVRPEARRAGLAQRLMEEALRFARQLDGVTHVQLCVSERAPGAAALYARLGFACWGVEPAAMCIDGTAVSEQHMVLVLGNARQGR